MELREITYRYIIDLTKFYLEVIRDETIHQSHQSLKDKLDRLVGFVKKKCPDVLNMNYVADLTIWPPDKIGVRKDNLVEFWVQIHGVVEKLPYRLYIKKGQEQEPIFIWNFNWPDHE